MAEEISECSSIRSICLLFFNTDDSSDSDTENAVFLVEYLSRESQQTNPPVNQPKRIIKKGISIKESYRDYRYFSLHQKLYDRFLPGPVSDTAGLQTQV